MPVICLLSLCFALVGGTLIAADPEFAGVWKLEESRSTIRNAPAAPCQSMRFEHTDGKLIARGLFSPCSEPYPALFTKDRKETRSTVGGIDRRSMLKWEGDALLINTIVNGANGTRYTEMDRLRLSRDGRTLRIRRQFISLHGETESELVYSREPDR